MCVSVFMYINIHCKILIIESGTNVLQDPENI